MVWKCLEIKSGISLSANAKFSKKWRLLTKTQSMHLEWTAEYKRTVDITNTPNNKNSQLFTSTCYIKKYLKKPTKHLGSMALWPFQKPPPTTCQSVPCGTRRSSHSRRSLCTCFDGCNTSCINQFTRNGWWNKIHQDVNQQWFCVTNDFKVLTVISLRHHDHSDILSAIKPPGHCNKNEPQSASK